MQASQQKAQKCVLIITDGIGYKPDSPYNAFTQAKKPTYDWLFENVPYSLIHTYGESVGLPHGQMGNSEVGHMSIGSGRVLYQDLVRISLAVDSGELAAHPLLADIATNARDIHLLGLMSDGGVHSHISHTIALARIMRDKGKRVFLHLITDGRDVLPTSALEYLAQIESLCAESSDTSNAGDTKGAQGESAKGAKGGVSIASICGRYYAMDRDKRWDRIQEAYNMLANATPATSLSPRDYIAKSYAENITDEFIKPAVFGAFAESGGFDESDGLIMSNFRSDRAREIIEALGAQDFTHFARPKRFSHIITMCEYDERFTYPILFTKQKPQNTLGEVLSRARKRQAHIAETEKYAHVTFFFNGGVEEPLEGETRVLIPSPKVATYDLKPEMSAPEVGDAVRAAMKDGVDFVVVNFANGDMVGHTGKLDAAIKAVEAVDSELGKIFALAQELGYAVVLTSDHGNCEAMQNEKGEILTNHTVGDVWCFVMAEGVKSVDSGALNNVAPSVLKIMGLEIPQEMDKPLV